LIRIFVTQGVTVADQYEEGINLMDIMESLPEEILPSAQELARDQLGREDDPDRAVDRGDVNLEEVKNTTVQQEVKTNQGEAKKKKWDQS
jgi:hypothetical protein